LDNQMNKETSQKNAQQKLTNKCEGQLQKT
jgi:hypothetical protein